MRGYVKKYQNKADNAAIGVEQCMMDVIWILDWYDSNKFS